LSPCIKTQLHLLTSEVKIIIDWKKYLFSGILRDYVSPTHAIVRSLDKEYFFVPFWRNLNSFFLWTLLIIPNDINIIE
jgi:hypothetical protein